MIIENMVIGDENVRNFDCFQHVVGIILDFMATMWVMEMAFFDDEQIKKIRGFSKCRSDHFRGPNRRKRSQVIGQYFIRKVFENVSKNKSFQLKKKHQTIIVF